MALLIIVTTMIFYVHSPLSVRLILSHHSFTQKTSININFTTQCPSCHTALTGPTHLLINNPMRI